MLQRDRVFDHYLDGVYYDRRPSLWVEPLRATGARARCNSSKSRPTTRSTTTSSPCGCRPSPPTAGNELRPSLRCTGWPTSPIRRRWRAASRPGSAAAASPASRARKGVRKFMVEFLGGPLENLPFGVKPEPVLWASRGTFSDYMLTEAVPDGVAGPLARAVRPRRSTGTDPVEMRCFLKNGDQVLTETWLFQYHPF